MATRPVDLNNIKGRIAEALVESIFRRAEFKMTRFGRESDLRGMMKAGRDESFTQDFLVMKEVEAVSRGVYQTHMIELKYRMAAGGRSPRLRKNNFGYSPTLFIQSHSWTSPS
jgi:hypothetical protein